MKYLDVILVIILILFVFELFKSCNEYFEDGIQTEYELSKYENFNQSKYVSIGALTLICKQRNNNERVWLYNYLKAPIGTNIVFYCRDTEINKEVKIVMAINKKTISSLAIMMRSENVFINDQKRQIDYYVKFISADEIDAEKEKIRNIKIKNEKLQLCLDLSKTKRITKNEAMVNCYSEIY
jgi:hypothetical protein